MTISLIPCHIQSDYELEEDIECIADKEQQKTYLDPDKYGY